MTYLAEEALRRLRTEKAALIVALDLVEEAIVLLDAAGSVLHANRAAHAMLDKGNGLSLSASGKLELADPQAADAVRSAMLRLAATDSAQPEHAEHERMIVSKRDGLPLVLSLHAVEQRPGAQNAAVAILTVCDPECRPGGRAATLKLVYGLTPGEAKLVQALNEGLTLKEFSDWSGLSYETVRSYLKRVLSKTGAHSQADLVRLTQTLS
ncbi:helix-turn-helix transcriptional regulator [Fontimonas sp. SYSU GA230001]|uniref:helix-turn-helix transcriptional regulator n=1 Tax=Fontimonas sp. SYSU GA230001 TaxID=3142450 RepID=UPI0032B341CF